jgi:hypothetical protein
MSKNTNLSFLTDYITADITNGRIGINNASPSYSLDVIGTTRISGSVYLATTSGSVGIGTTTPVTLDSGGTNLQIKDRSTLFQLGAVNSTYLSNNIFYDGSWKRIVSGSGALIRLNDDSNGISFLTTGAGAANSEVTFTSAMNIINAGNVGIGVTPFTWYTGYTSLQLGESTALFSNRTSADTRTTQLSNNAYLNSNASNWIYGATDEATRYGQVDGTHEFYTAPTGTGSNAITWSTRLTITNTGRVLISGDVWGTERFGVVLDSSLASSTGITAYTTNPSYNGSLIRVQAETTGGTGWYGYELRASGGILKYGIYGNGTVTAPSDERRKKNIETTRDGYLQDVCNLRVVKYNWNEDAEGKDKELGFVAQEVEQIFPKLVETGFDGMNNENEVKLLKQGVLIPILVKAIQELKAEVELLKQQ